MSKIKDNYDEEPNTRYCDKCMKEINIDDESHFESTFDNHLCFECGDKVLSFKFDEDDYSYIDYNVFTEYDESCNYGYEECWKLEEK